MKQQTTKKQDTTAAFQNVKVKKEILLRIKKYKAKTGVSIEFVVNKALENELLKPEYIG